MRRSPRIETGRLERIVVRQSARWSTSRRRPSRRPRAPQLTSPPPISTYGFQKLASEYFAKGAWEQYKLPYTIVRPFNCVGIGERRARPRHRRHERQRQARPAPRRPGPRAEGAQGPGPAAHPRRRVAGPPLHLRRRPGARHPARDGGAGRRQRRLQPVDRARPRPSSSWPRRSGARSTATDAPFRYVCDPPFEHDVQLRVPDVRKARDVLGFEATTSLDDDARRGHPVDPERGGGRPAVSRLLAGAVRRPVRRARGQREGRGLATRSSATCSGTSTPTRRSSISPATEATSSVPCQAAERWASGHP